MCRRDAVLCHCVVCRGCCIVPHCCVQGGCCIVIMYREGSVLSLCTGRVLYCHYVQGGCCIMSFCCVQGGWCIMSFCTGRVLYYVILLCTRRVLYYVIMCREGAVWWYYVQGGAVLSLCDMLWGSSMSCPGGCCIVIVTCRGVLYHVIGWCAGGVLHHPRWRWRRQPLWTETATGRRTCRRKKRTLGERTRWVVPPPWHCPFLPFSLHPPPSLLPLSPLPLPPAVSTVHAGAAAAFLLADCFVRRLVLQSLASHLLLSFKKQWCVVFEVSHNVVI